MALFTLFATWIVFFYAYKWMTRSKTSVSLSPITRNSRFLVCPGCHHTTAATNGNNICSNCRIRL